MKGVNIVLLTIGCLLLGATWSYLRIAIPAWRFRREFLVILTARSLAADEGRWEDWDRLNMQMDEHFARREAWLAKSKPLSIRTMTWQDVKEKGDE